jgi:Rad3-related DNA helicase
VEDELIQLARNIRGWQEAQTPKVSDEQMLKRFAGLGSTKTYRRLRDGDTDGLVCDNHLPKYRGTWAQIESASGAAAAESIYPDLTPSLECAVAVAGLIPQRGKTRLVLIEGPTGSGKTSALGIIAEKYVGSVARTEAHEGWASLNCALGDIAVALGASREDLPSSTSDRLTLCIGLAQKQRRVLLIDEGHHCTAQVLNAIKTFLNLTDSVVVIAGIDTLWRKLTARSWEEARQLIHNRLYERVRLAAPSAADVVTFLTRRLPALPIGEAKSAAPKVAAMSSHLGHFAFLRRVAERLAAQPDDLDAIAILAAATALKATLETR